MEFGLNDYVARVTNVKPAASAYIDDRGVTFVSWASTLDEIDKRRPPDGSGWLRPAGA